METTSLSTSEGEKLVELETRIEHGMKTFVDVGTALMEVKEKNLFRATSDTFEGYCQVRWGMTRRHANRLIEAAEVIGDISNGTNWSRDSEPKTPLPATEAQARPMKPVPREDRAEVWKEAVETAPHKNGKAHVTAKHVETVVAKRAAPVKEPEPAPPAAPDPQPWLRYNELVEQAIDLTDQLRDTCDAIRKEVFGGWRDQKADATFFKNLRTTFQQYRVTGWAQPNQRLTHKGNFTYVMDQPKRGGKS